MHKTQGSEFGITFVVLTCPCWGDLVRSKYELVVADKLHVRGIDYTYEQPLVLPNGRTRYPDFTITDHARGVTFYWERRRHDGCCGTLGPPSHAMQRHTGGPPPGVACGRGRHNTLTAQSTSSRSPRQAGVAVCGPTRMPACSSRATTGASGGPTTAGNGGASSSGRPSGRTKRTSPSAPSATRNPPSCTAR